MWRQRLESSRAGSRAALTCAVLCLLAASSTRAQELLLLPAWQIDTSFMGFFATSERSVALTVTELGTGRVTSSVRFVAYGPDEQVLARHEDFLQRGHPAAFTLRLDPSMPRKLRFRITIVGQTVGNTQPAVVVEDVDGLNLTIAPRISFSLPADREGPVTPYCPPVIIRQRHRRRVERSCGVLARARPFALLCATAVVPATIAAQPATPSPFDNCTPPAGEPWTQDRLLCLYRTGMRTGTLPEARLRLERLGAGNTAQPWATMALGYAVQEQDERRALALYEIAAAGFAQARDAEGEVLARHNLRNIYQRRGDAAAAAQQVAQAIKVAEASGQPMPMARAAVLEASHEIQTGGDVGRAYRTLQRGYRFAFPSGPIGLRRSILLNLANASLYLGRLEEATDALEQHRALRKEDGSTVDAGTVAFNLLNAHLTQGEQRPTTTARERLIKEAAAVLVEVQQLQRPALVALTHRVLADLTRTSDPATAAMHLERCLALEKPLGHPGLRATCLWTSSLLDAGRDRRARGPDGPRRARRPRRVPGRSAARVRVAGAIAPGLADPDGGRGDGRVAAGARCGGAPPGTAAGRHRARGLVQPLDPRLLLAGRTTAGRSDAAPGGGVRGRRAAARESPARAPDAGRAAATGTPCRRSRRRPRAVPTAHRPDPASAAGSRGPGA